MTAPTDGAAVARDVHEVGDVVVVGSGAGGAVVARELAARGRDVVLVEEGGFFTGRDFTGNPRAMIDLLYRNRGLTGALGRPPIPIPLGRCVGGTTTINSGTCYRAPDYVLEEWTERYGVRGVREPELRPCFERVEAELNVQPVPDETYGRNSALFERGAAALGYTGARIPRNTRGCLGTGVCAFGCPQDGKQAMHVSYVPRALADGARLYTRCRVERVLLSGGRAIGIVGRFVDAAERDTGRELRVLARHVVMACGALLTPALLERSGVPDPSGQRGQNLHIHPATRVGALYEEEVRGWEEVPQAYNVHHFTREGIFIQGQFVPPAMEAPVLPGVGTAHKARMASFARLGSFGALISDESAGRVRAGRGRWPRVTYRLGPADAAKLARAIGLTAEIFFAAGAREVYSGVHSRPVLRSIDEARALQQARLPAADFEMMAFHPQGTARMGEDPRTAVTDSVGRVHGTAGLWVSDASLLPSSCKVNPQITIMALATRVAQQLSLELAA
jgi:choline dehydrogenase-like flavoprotein